LTLAHSASLLHLRLSPSKILVGGGSGDGEQVKLLELGIAPALLELLPGGLTSDVPSKEERAYLAPEQRKGELGGAAADVFALGVILYELAAGKLPIQAVGDEAGASQVTSLPQLLPSWQRPLAVLLERMLMNDPLARPSMGEVAAQLQHLTAQQPTSATSLPPSGTSLPPSGTSLPPSGTSLPPSASSLPPTGGDAAVGLADDSGCDYVRSRASVRPSRAPRRAMVKPDSLSDGQTRPQSRARAVGDGLGYARTITPAQAGPTGGGDPSDTPVAVEISADYTENSAAGPGGRAGEGGTAATSAEPGVGGQVALRSGQLVGNYRVNAKIGQGGMGAVYAAVHKQIGRRAAIKVLHGPLGGDGRLCGAVLK
jgi:serine/threonine protein kinase